MTHMKFKKIINLALIFLIASSILSMTTTLAMEDKNDQPSLNDINTINRVVVFSLDAFRYDYLLRTEDAPTFEWFKEQGVTAAYSLPSNPSVTAINHVSIITGNQPNVHGIMGNSFFDWEDMKTYSMFTDASDPYRDTNTGLHLLQTKPSVIHAEENDVKTAVLAWPYVDYGTNYEGIAPTYVYDYDWFGANNLRTDKGIAGKTADVIIADPEVKLVFSWLPAVDSVGHYSGPESPNVKTVIETAVDTALRTFFEKLDSAGLLEETVVILTSDHGMAEVSDSYYFLEEKQFYLDAVGNTSIEPYIVHDAPVEFLYFFGETNASKVEEFGSYLKGQPGIQTVYVNDENAVIDLDNAPRGINISVWLEPGYSRHFGSPYLGMHGYLNDNDEMKGFFMAAGPGIEPDSTVGGINNVDIAPTALNMLGLDAGFDTSGTILSSIFGTRTTAFSYPDMYAPTITKVTINPTGDPPAGSEVGISVKVNEYGTIALAEAEISISNGTTTSVDLVDIGGNNTLFGTLGKFEEDQTVTVTVTVEDGLGLQDISDPIIFTVGAPEKTSYSLISLLSLILVIPFVQKRKRN